MMYLQRRGPVPQEVNIVLEGLGLPEFHMRLHTLPPR